MIIFSKSDKLNRFLVSNDLSSIYARPKVPMKTRRSILKVEIKSQGQVMTNDLDVQDLPTHFHGHSRILVLYY